YLYGDDGADYLDGGEGIDDIAVYWPSPVGVTIDLGTGTGSGGHAEGDTLVNIEGIWGSYYEDILIGDFGMNYLYGNSGTDELYGGGGVDILDGGSDADYLYGGEDDDRLYGGGGADYLYGEKGDDRLEGEKGADELVGGSGSDTLSGGSGVDTHVWRTGDHGPGGGTFDTDTVTDFVLESDGDILKFDQILQGVTEPSNAAELANYLHFDATATETTISVDVDGGTDTHLEIVLDGVTETHWDTWGDPTTDADYVQILLNNNQLEVVD
ncbi:MAG: hypothetical protein AMJ43_03585, partial [Coxiella sp. DG_40]